MSCKTKVKLLLYVGISHPLVNGYLHTVCQIVVLDHVINPFSIKTLADVYTPVQITSIDTNSPTLWHVHVFWKLHVYQFSRIYIYIPVCGWSHFFISRKLLIIAFSYPFLSSSSIPISIIGWSHFLIRRQDNWF